MFVEHIDSKYGTCIDLFRLDLKLGVGGLSKNLVKPWA